MDISSLLKLYRYNANIFYIQIALIVIAMAVSALYMRSPRKMLDVDMAFYRSFNWKIEPISMEKAIKNTRNMGIAIFMFGLVSLIGILLIYTSR